MKCVKCGAHVSDEEYKERYNELSKMGIVPYLVPMCKPCREVKK